MTTREAILIALRDLLATRPDLFPPATIDEPEPTRWTPTVDNPRAEHAAMVMDGGPPEELAFVHGDAGDPLSELELEAAIGYAVQVKASPGQSMSETRAERRALRDLAVRGIADLIAANPNLGLGQQVWADVRSPTRDDDVTMKNSIPAATAVLPIRVLYAGADAAA